MFSNCVRQILSKKLNVNVARNLLSGRQFSGRKLVIFQSSSEGHLLRTLPVRSFSVSKAFFENANATQEDYMYGEDSEEWTKVNDNTDEATGAFSNFNLSQKTIRKLNDQGIQYLFPVQSNTYRPIYDELDVIVQARTGSGKTMSYAIPLVEKLLSTRSKSQNPRMLVLTPTRELANQVAQVVDSLTDELKVVPVYGGASISSQENQLRRRADIVVGTPGRILDLISRGSLNLNDLEHVVLDEVDRMLDMGFADDVDKILKNRYRQDNRDSNPQTLLFSATVPHWVRETSKKYLSRDLKMIDLIGKHSNRTAVNVKHMAVACSVSERIGVIQDALRRHSEDGSVPKVIVFCQTKREVDSLGRSSALVGKVGMLHGDISQSVRESTLSRFKEGYISCLVATDVAARGLDVPDVDVVIQCSPPTDVESYIHRSGRTGRAGKSGESILLYTPEEFTDLRKIEGIAGFTFEKVAFKKSMEDVQKDIVRAMRNIGESSRLKFEGIADRLMESSDPKKLLSTAFAVIAGHEQKSLITFQPGFVTCQLNCKRNISNKWEAESLIKEMVPGTLVHNIRICADHRGFVFDIPMQKEKTLLESCEGDENSSIKVLEVLPNLDTSVSGRRTESYGSGHRYGSQRRSSDLGSRRFSERSLSQFGEEQYERNFEDRSFGRRRTEYGDRKFGERDSGDRSFERKRSNRPESIARWRDSRS